MKAIDEAIHGNLGPQHSHVGQLEVNEANNGKGMDMEIVESKATITDQKSAEIKDIPCFQKRMELGDLMQSEFNMGWVENEKATKGRKGVTKRKTARSELGLSRPT